MSRFQTRTRYVEAIQHENMHETTAWLNSIEDAEEIEYTVAAGTLLIVTGGKRCAILPGDWIVLDGNTLRLYAANSFDDAYLPADPLCFDAPTTGLTPCSATNGSRRRQWQTMRPAATSKATATPSSQ